MSNNSRIKIKEIITKIRNRYEGAGISKLNILQKSLNDLELTKDAWTQEDKERFEATTMEAILLQASLQGGFSALDAVLLELGYLDESTILDNNAKKLKDISGDTGTIKYSISSTNN